MGFKGQHMDDISLMGRAMQHPQEWHPSCMDAVSDHVAYPLLCGQAVLTLSLRFFVSARLWHYAGIRHGVCRGHF